MIDPSESGVRPGRIVGERYELRSLIATGGMAQVWHGHDPVLQRSVAIKVLHPHLAGDRGFLARFHREAVAAARLSHPSIVSIFDTVSDAGIEAIVMELLVGRTLREALDELGQLDDPMTLEVGRQVADALHEAHRGGVIHRDIKPSNILLCADQRVVVTDFGIAKASEDTDLTVTGTLLGTAKYLSPEQVEGGTIDPRSDIYSLGVVLFECATGEVPFRAEGDAATALARLHQAAPLLRRHRPDAPIDLELVVDRCLARQPSARPSTAADLHAQLSGVNLDLEPGGRDATVFIAPDRTPDPEPYEHDERLDEPDAGEIPITRMRSWFGSMLAVILIGVAIVVASLLFTVGGRGGTDDSTTGATEAPAGDTTVLSPIIELTAPVIASATPLDPGGDGVEQNELVAAAFDGDASTAWPTETYRRPALGGLKDGVGLRLDLDGPAAISAVELDTLTDGFAIDVYVGIDLGEIPQGWAAPAGGVTGGSGSVTIELPGEPVGNQVVLWITEQGRSLTDERLRLEIVEIRLR